MPQDTNRAQTKSQLADKWARAAKAANSATERRKCLYKVTKYRRQAEAAGAK